MGTSEDNFIRKLEIFMDDEFPPFTKNKINTLLREYRDEMPPMVIRKVVEKSSEPFKPNLPIVPIKITDEQLMLLASEICLSKNISINEFMQSKNGKCRNDISEVRKEFCQKLVSTYVIPKKQLKEFFGVNHTTISFYIHGKRLRPKKQIA